MTGLRSASPFFPVSTAADGRRPMGLDVLSKTYLVEDVQASTCPWCNLIFESAANLIARLRPATSTSITTKVDTLHKNGPGYVFVKTCLTDDIEDQINSDRVNQVEERALRVIRVHGR